MLEGMRLWEEEEGIMVPGTAAQLLLPLLSSEALESILPSPAPVRWDGAWARSRYKRGKTGESGRPSLEPPSSEAPISGEGISAGQFGSGVESSERITSASDEQSSCRFDGSGLGSSGRKRSEPGAPGSSAGLMPRLGS